MIQTVYKKIFSALVLSMLLGFASVPMPAQGQPEIDLVNTPTQVNMFAGFNVGNVANDPRILIRRYINVVMGFLGMLAVIVILFAGFRWMTAAGNKEHVEAAQKLLINGVIGLIIIFSAWTLAWFVVNILKIEVRKNG
ncbi:hypothetical protein HYW94_00460 [Candidatus Uhrbacteria bacterium]|nr:hypothetical protein [Candidatus Uhrbacteria bacterium]